MMKHGNKSGFSGFWKGMAIYAAIFLVIAAIGLVIFWNFMEAYEASRPKTAIDHYMESLTEEHICDLSQDLIDQVDHSIQTQQECRDYMMDHMGNLDYAKKSKECTDKRQVFVLRSDKTVIGEVSITTQEKGSFGFTPWAVEEEHFDLTALDLFGSGYEITVPADHTVTANGIRLDDSYVVDDKIPYEEIADYYESFDLPYRVTYAVKPIMGEMETAIYDPDGNEVTFDETTDWTQYFRNCTDSEIEELEVFTEKYVNRYVAFTGSRKGTRYLNYDKLMDYVVYGSDFALRLYNAIDGFAFGQSQHDIVTSRETNYQVRLDDTHYLCDIAYTVDTKGHNGWVSTATNAKLVIIRTEEGLKVESMSIY